MLLLLLATLCRGQTSPEALQKILDRLDAIEKQNRDLLEEVQSLRQQLKEQNANAQTAPQPEREAINEQRVRELAQTKVEASARYPVSLTGMVLFDAFSVTGTKNSLFQAAYPDYSAGPPGGGATFNQSIIGLRFTGPQLPYGGRANGFLSMDFYAGSNEYQTFRLRRAGISFDWSRRSITVSKDKPLIAPYEPLSYARVGVPALVGAGNLWLWLPQIRYDERLSFGSGYQGTFSAAVLETDEGYGYSGATPVNNRPALESRFELKRTSEARTLWSAGFGGHYSESHVSGRSVPSRVISADLRFAPMRWFEMSGTVLTGENFANLGGIGPGVQQIGDKRDTGQIFGGMAPAFLPDYKASHA